MSNISDPNYAEMCKNVFAQLQIICTHLFSSRRRSPNIPKESHRRAPRKLACMQAGMQAGLQRGL